MPITACNQGTLNMARTPRKVLSPQEATIAKAARAVTKKANFVKIAQKRTTKAIKAISLLENLANRGSYTYTYKQSARVVAALQLAVESVARKLADTVSKAEAVGFEFEEGDAE
jgi:hypothetical protein